MPIFRHSFLFLVFSFQFLEKILQLQLGLELELETLNRSCSSTKTKVARSIDLNLAEENSPVFAQNFKTLHESRDVKRAIFALFLTAEKLFLYVTKLRIHTSIYVV